ncbi:hypothetical protein QTO34_000428 [Cnephaeus nilssonii]|uniref:Uncharacterized protein n=1 Tax=Cnephaeus nilssonii TaxID=3371016 RepID=A0AA40IC02_CNENI|nr:hypothetical protein QTO34_000428 [Eptesicus nilssonii]
MLKAGERNRLTSPGSTENPKQEESKEDHTKTLMPRAENKERILISAREKQLVTYKGVLI